jgi:RNA polymerase sigma-70 factor (ECF subfamily)
MTPGPDADADAQLWDRLRHGDEAALVGLYRERAGALLRFLVRLTGSVTLAEDVLQDVFVALMDRRADRYDPARGTLRSYLFGIARHTAARRTRMTGPRPVMDGGATGERRDDDEQAVRAALLRLPPAFREVVLLCDLEGLRYEEAATALAVPVGTVRSRLSRARAQLADLLSDESPAARPAARKEAR